MCILIIAVASCANNDDKYELLITDISEYDSKIKILDSWKIFPKSIPENTSNAVYRYYQYFSDRDVYLELSFFDRGSMEGYIDSIKNNLDPEKTLTKSNPYNSNYTDLFAFYMIASSKPDGEWKNYLYYKTEPLPYGGTRISSVYSVISYSYDDLTVITACFDGVRIIDDDKDQKLIPFYLKHFNANFKEPFEYYVYQEEAVNYSMS